MLEKLGQNLYVNPSQITRVKLLDNGTSEVSFAGEGVIVFDAEQTHQLLTVASFDNQKTETAPSKTKSAKS